MVFIRSLALFALTGALLSAGQLPEDPVLKARAQRAQAQGINEADLPAVPKSITEPPPLPPPEVHRKDTPAGARAAAKASRKGKAAKLKRGAGARGSAKAAKAVAEEEETPVQKGKAASRKGGKGGKSAKGAKGGKAPRSAKPGKRSPAPKSGSGHRTAKRGRGGRKGKA